MNPHTLQVAHIMKDKVMLLQLVVQQGIPIIKNLKAVIVGTRFTIHSVDQDILVMDKMPSANP